MLKWTQLADLFSNGFWGDLAAGGAFSHHHASFPLPFLLCRASKARRNAPTITTSTLTSLFVFLFWPALWASSTDFDSARNSPSLCTSGMSISRLENPVCGIFIA